MSLCRNKIKTVKTTRYDWSSLTNRDISNKYRVTVRIKFDTPQEISGTHILNEEYKDFINALMEAMAEECIATKPKAKCRVSWETLADRKK